MGKKKKVEKPVREITKRQLSHFQKQQRRQRIIFGSGILVIAAIIVLVSVGWFNGMYRPLHTTVIQVNDTKYNLAYYIDALRLAGTGESQQYVEQLASSAADEIQLNELVRQGAAVLGITVSDTEAKEKLKEYDLPINAASIDIIRAQLLNDKLLAEYFDTVVPQTADQVHMMAMLLESNSQSTEIRAELESSGNFSALAEEYSLDYYTKANGGDLGWHGQTYLNDLMGTSIPVEYAFGSEVNTLSQPRYDENVSKGVGYWLIKIIERVEESDAQIQAMLLGSEEEALAVTARINAGEDFATLAAELSQDQNSKESSGELGIISSGERSVAFDSFAFNPDSEIGVLSPPIRDDAVITQGGYWLIQIVEKEDDRQIDNNERDYLKSKAFDQWISMLDTNYTFNLLSESQKAYAIARVVKG